MAWQLGAVKPWVKACAEEVGTKFSVTTIYGVGLRPNVSDHPLGLALDFMVGTDREKGQAITDYILANHTRLSIKYVIWWRRIWNPSSGWKPYSGISPHTDHPHVSFLSTPNAGSGTPTGINVGIDINPIDDVKDAINGIVDIFKAWQGAVLWLMKPQNWLRIASFIMGTALVLNGMKNLAGVNVGLPIQQLLPSKGSVIADTVKKATKTEPTKDAE